MFKQLSSILLVWFISVHASANQSYEEQDPYEPFNRLMFDFNNQLDSYVLKPTAKLYKYVTPTFVNEGVTNFFNNLGDVETFANSLLQAKFHNATVTLNRIIYNTTFGLGGFIDVATYFGLENEEEDFGQTLAVWGYRQSDYLVLPLFGPSTFRDFGGRFVDSYFDPVAYMDEVNRDQRLLGEGLKIVDKRADLLGAENLLLDEDKYRFVRSAYLQNREFNIMDGNIEDPFADEDLDAYDDF